MRKLLFLLVAAAALAFCQVPAPKNVTVCWQPEGGAQTCNTFQAGSVSLLTLDLRMRPVEAIVVQSLPPYMVSAMQQQVEAQTYHMQQADGSVEVKQRFSSVQDLFMQYLVRSVMVPALKLYPPTGADAGKDNPSAITTDLKAGETIIPIF